MGGRLPADPLPLASAVSAALAAGMLAAAVRQAAGMSAAAELQAAGMAVAADSPAVHAAGSLPAAVPPVFFREAGECQLLFR